MAEPPKPKRRVTAQIPISSSPKLNPSASSTTTPTSTRPGIARVDSSNISRPSLRSSQSSSSIRASVTSTGLNNIATAGGRAKSPTRLKSPLLSSNDGGGIKARVRKDSIGNGSPSPYEANAGTGRARAKVGNFAPVEDITPPTRPKIHKSNTQPPPLPIKSRAPSIVSGSSARVKAIPTPLTSPQILGAVPMISPMFLEQPFTPSGSSNTNSENRRRSLSPGPGAIGRSVARSSISSSSSTAPPAKPPRPRALTPSALPAFNRDPTLSQDCTASAPPSPHHSTLPPPAKLHAPRRHMPDHPNSIRPPIPSLPLEPSIRTVELPPLTPQTTNDSERRRDSSVDDPASRRESWANESRRSDRGSVVVGLGLEEIVDDCIGSVVGQSEDAKAQDKKSAEDLVDEELEQENVEEARINRKIADLEISNASLLAINRSLEIGKSKQRAEIQRLRRALRESLSGPLLPSLLSNTSISNSSSSALHNPSPFSRFLPDSFPLDPDDLEEEVSIEEADMEERWKKLEIVLNGMQKRAEGAVKAVEEEMRHGGRAVLGEKYDEEDDGAGTGGPGTPERRGEG